MTPARGRVRLRAAIAGDDGAVTVEAALGIASIVTVLLLAVGAMASAIVQVRVVDAAREAARVAACAGVDDGRRAGVDAAPEGATVVVTPGSSGAGGGVDGGAGGGAVVAEVSADGVLPGLVLRARAVARVEPGA